MFGPPTCLTTTLKLTPIIAVDVGMGVMKRVEVVAAIVVDSQHRILMAQRADWQHQGGKWEFPGGSVEADESPEEAMIRELKEELGVDSTINEKLGIWSFTYPFLHVELHVFLVSTEDSLDSSTLTVHKSMKWVNSEESSKLDWLEADLPIVQHLQSLGY